MSYSTGAAPPPRDEQGCSQSVNPSPRIARWTALEDLSRREPSLPVRRPGGAKGRARWERVDGLWRALLAQARDPGRRDPDPIDLGVAGS